MSKEKNELPKGWEWTSVGEIYNIVGGGTPSTSIEEYWEGDFAWVSSADIFGLKDIRPRKFITKAAIENSATNLVPEGSLIVVTRVGLGKVALAKMPICFSQDSQALIGDCSSPYPDYSLCFLSQAVQVFKYQSRGTTIAGVTKKQLAELPFSLPPLAEQYRIVAEIEKQLTRLEEGVAALQRAQAKLKHYRAAVLKAAVEGKLTEAWRADHPTTEPATILLERILKERYAKWEADLRAKGKDPTKVKYIEPAKPDMECLPELPEGWCYTLLPQLLSITRKGITTGPFGSLLKKHEHRSEGVPVLGIENIEAMKFVPGSKVYIGIDKAEQLSKYSAQAGDVLVSRSGTVGEVCVVPEHLGEARISTNVVRVSLASHGMLSQFFCLLFNGSPFILKQISELCKGSLRDFLNQAILSSIILPLPPVAEQQQIIAEVDQRLSMITQLEAIIEANLKRAEHLRQSILKEAFAGRLVPQDPNDEPASVLLERIRKEREGRKNRIVGNGRYVKVSDEPVQIDVEGTRQVELWEGVGG